MAKQLTLSRASRRPATLPPPRRPEREAAAPRTPSGDVRERRVAAAIVIFTGS